jgi:hypothetical protein
MLRKKKPITSKTLCTKIKNTESVEDLADLIASVHLQPAGFEIDPYVWADARPKDLVVLETLAVRLRQLIEIANLDSESGDTDSGEEDPEYEL